MKLKTKIFVVIFGVIVVSVLYLSWLVKNDPATANFIIEWLIFFGVVGAVLWNGLFRKKTSKKNQT